VLFLLDVLKLSLLMKMLENIVRKVLKKSCVLFALFY